MTEDSLALNDVFDFRLILWICDDTFRSGKIIKSFWDEKNKSLFVRFKYSVKMIHELFNANNSRHKLKWHISINS